MRNADLVSLNLNWDIKKYYLQAFPYSFAAKKRCNSISSSDYSRALEFLMVEEGIRGNFTLLKFFF